jgi:two-component system phosphate regulon sensor histidine kinase PhoR
MGLAILGITGFQVYWLKENYAREKRTLTIRAAAAFRESVLELQVSKLKLDNIIVDSNAKSSGNLRVIVSDHEEDVKFRVKPGQKIISTINVIRDKLRDSLNREKKPGLFIVNKKSNGPLSDTVKLVRRDLNAEKHIAGVPGKGNRMFSLLYGVDSLQDSLRLSEIDSSYRTRLREEKMNFPYKISRIEKPEDPDMDLMNEVTIGLANPVTYRMDLGNSVPYLLRRISLPILFSILLLGITVLSFILLYRNLLRQQKLAVLKNDFISNITHELKTPIATVGVAIEALKNFNAIDDPKRTREYLDISSNELQRLGFLVDKVLKLSMFEKKEMDLKYELVNLKEVVDEVVDSLKLQFEKYRAIVNVTSNADVTMQGDRLHLLSVVFNLLDNAMKYSNDNPAVSIVLEGNENNVSLTVADNGIGIEPVYKEKIFEKFFRVPQGNVHNAKGYGLGLSYVAEVVKKHKGSIQVDSKPGKGTTFTIILPKRTTNNKN